MNKLSIIDPPSPIRSRAETRKYAALRKMIERKYWRDIWIFKADGSLEIYDKFMWQIGRAKLIKRFAAVE